ncbi:hypothetical protein Taro_022216 [Colocasia esculenta]|uniref:Uncharacterized protein n=1 Tax=Colocasia esculenta TaxID=4460 RepID=A0A843V190_COLES|nr:hypothetical protein [Colocasia esculenta]
MSTQVSSSLCSGYEEANEIRGDKGNEIKEVTRDNTGDKPFHGDPWNDVSPFPNPEIAFPRQCHITPQPLLPSCLGSLASSPISRRQASRLPSRGDWSAERRRRWMIPGSLHITAAARRRRK